MGKYDFFNSDSYGIHQKILNKVGFNKNVLDVGCAAGVLSRRMKLNGCNVVGIEFDIKSAKKAQNYCEDIIIGNVESLELEKKYENYFDSIVFADVLEHLIDPLVVLQRFKDYLKDDGYIIISVSNVANWRMRMKLLFGNFDYEDRGLLDYSHLRFFTLKTVRKLVSDADFEIVNLDVSLKGIKKLTRVIHYISLIWPNLFAYQFLVVAKKR